MQYRMKKAIIGICLVTVTCLSVYAVGPGGEPAASAEATEAAAQSEAHQRTQKLISEVNDDIMAKAPFDWDKYERVTYQQLCDGGNPQGGTWMMEQYMNVTMSAPVGSTFPMIWIKDESMAVFYKETDGTIVQTEITNDETKGIATETTKFEGDPLPELEKTQ